MRNSSTFNNIKFKKGYYKYKLIKINIPPFFSEFENKFKFDI